MKVMCYVNGKDLLRARKRLFLLLSQVTENTDVNNITKVVDALNIVESNLDNSSFALRVEEKEILEKVGAI